jgi:hypothetical protein
MWRLPLPDDNADGPDKAEAMPLPDREVDQL